MKAAQNYPAWLEQLTLGSPSAVIRGCFQAQVLDEEQSRAALRMAQDRNLTVHTYNEALAEEIYARLPAHAQLMEEWLKAMDARRLPPHPDNRMRTLETCEISKTYDGRKVVDDVSVYAWPGRGGRAARAQRRRQDDVVLHDRRADQPGLRDASCSDARRHHRAADVPARAAAASATCRRSLRSSASSPSRTT